MRIRGGLLICIMSRRMGGLSMGLMWVLVFYFFFFSAFLHLVRWWRGFCGVWNGADNVDAGYEPDLLEDEVGEGRVLERHVRTGLMVDEDGNCTDSESEWGWDYLGISVILIYSSPAVPVLL